MEKLTAKQQRFCDEYLIDLNATQAAIRAGYSAKNADKIGPELLGKTRVAEYIAERKQDRVARVEITQDMVINELAMIAFSKATDFAKVVEKEAYVTVNGKSMPLFDDKGNRVKYKTVEAVLTDELSDEQRRVLASVKESRNGIEIKPHDKVKALELLGKHLGMWTEKVEVTEKQKDAFDELSVEELRQLIEDD